MFPAHYRTLRNYLSSFSVAYEKRKKSYPDMEIYREQWAANKSQGGKGGGYMWLGGMKVFLTVLVRRG